VDIVTAAILHATFDSRLYFSTVLSYGQKTDRRTDVRIVSALLNASDLVAVA